jgi:hypothetical protein
MTNDVCELVGEYLEVVRFKIEQALPSCKEAMFHGRDQYSRRR